MSNIPTPFVGGTDSPRRSSAEEMALEPPYTPGGGAAEEAGVAGESEAADQRGTERAIQVEVSDLDEEDLLPDMAAEAEEIAIEGPTYDLEWPEETEPEAPADLGEVSGSAPVVAEPPVAEPKEQPVASNMEVPDFLLGPDSGEAELSAEPIGEDTAVSTDRLAELALSLQEGTHGESIQDLVAELSVHKPEIAVPRAFAAGYLAAKKEEEEEE